MPVLREVHHPRVDVMVGYQCLKPTSPMVPRSNLIKTVQENQAGIVYFSTGDELLRKWRRLVFGCIGDYRKLPVPEA